VWNFIEKYLRIFCFLFFCIKKVVKMNRKRGNVLKDAARDFELANRYKAARDYITASNLYRAAASKILTALVSRRVRKALSRIDDIEYLALQTRLPKDIKNELLSSIADERDEIALEEELEERDELEMTRRAELEEYNSALSKYNVVKRLMDYASTRF